MTRIARWFIAVVAMVLVARPIYAQTPPSFIPDVASIRQMLESPTPREQAWGAWLAAQAQAKELAPLLRQVASTHRLRREPEVFATSAALDALIQLGGPQPAAWARTFFDKWPAESLILLSRAGDDATPPLMELAASQTGIRWLTTTNLLLARRPPPPGFAAIVLRGLELPAELLIVPEGNTSTGGGGGASVSVGDGIPRRAPGFPPLARYYLTSGALPGYVVLATGPKTIFYIRDVSAPGESPASHWHDDPRAPSSRDRLDLIAMLADTPDRSLPIKSYESRNVVRRADLSIEKETAVFRADIEERYRRLLSMLVSKGLMTKAEEAAMPLPRVNITVREIK